MLLERGVNFEVIQELLGHASPRVTLEIYAHLPSTGLDAVAHAMSEFLAIKSQIEGTSEGTRQNSPSRGDKEKARVPNRDTGLSKLGRSRDRTCDPSRVKRVLYR